MRGAGGRHPAVPCAGHRSKTAALQPFRAPLPLQWWTDDVGLTDENEIEDPMNTTPTRALVIALGVLLLAAGAAFAGLQTDNRLTPGGPGINNEQPSATESPEATELPEANESLDPSENESGDDRSNDAIESPEGAEQEDSGSQSEPGGDDAQESGAPSTSPEPSESPEADD